MWALLGRRTQVLVLVGTTLLTYWALEGLFALAGNAPLSPFKYVTMIAFTVAVIFLAIANQIWRKIWRSFPLLSTLAFPDLNGIWKGTLQSTWRDENGSIVGPIDVTVRIRQTLLTISIHQQTVESESWSFSVTPEATREAGRFALWYGYGNRPSARVAERSAQHEGAARLEWNPAIDRERLTGQYYTSRKTSGDLVLTRVDPAR